MTKSILMAVVSQNSADIFPSVEESCRFKVNGIDRVQWSDDGHKTFIQQIPWAINIYVFHFVQR